MTHSLHHWYFHWAWEVWRGATFSDMIGCVVYALRFLHSYSSRPVIKTGLETVGTPPLEKMGVCHTVRNFPDVSYLQQ